ncbi:Palmitoyltransferase ZDHHC13 [Frankliniella fusca]|uniref:Palmitoyltransferase ZDHHC13 n=1 Tax=Frankliniella fusca TaxID=407009 RepID=A0AAE1L967_9NEOP|nr:Palmitoyltransferase ZDHHC13 [Frankliniella fusca]
MNAFSLKARYLINEWIDRQRPGQESWVANSAEDKCYLDCFYSGQCIGFHKRLHYFMIMSDLFMSCEEKPLQMKIRYMV